MDTPKKTYFNNKTDRLYFFTDIRAELILLVFFVLLFALILFACRTEGRAVTPAPARTEARFESGTFVLGEDIGGLTAAEAEARLEPLIAEGMRAFSCRLYSGEREFVLDAGSVTVKSDADAVLKAAMTSGAGEYEVIFRADDDAKLTAALEKIADKLRVEAIPSKLLPLGEATPEELAGGESNARFVVTAARDGTEPDIAAARRLVLSGETDIEFPAAHPKPDGAPPKLPRLMAAFSTSYTGKGLSAPNRVANIQKAAAIINGSTLAPGESLSCNAALGERTEEAGWKSATAFANGGRDTEQQFGGGICQVSTTLYNCALLTGLRIDQRSGHSRRVSYVPGGLDAALSWGSTDLVVRNSLSEPVYFFMWTDESEGRLYCEIYGPGFGGSYDGIRVESELIERIEPGDAEFEIDPALSPGQCVLKSEAAAGSVYRSYRIFTKNGAEQWRETVAETIYPMRPAVYAVPPGEGGQ